MTCLADIRFATIFFYCLTLSPCNRILAIGANRLYIFNDQIICLMSRSIRFT